MKFATVKVKGKSQVVLVEKNNSNVLLLQAAAIKMGEAIPTTLIECIEKAEVFLQKAKKIEQWASTQKNINQNFMLMTLFGKLQFRGQRKISFV